MLVLRPQLAKEGEKEWSRTRLAEALRSDTKADLLSSAPPPVLAKTLPPNEETVKRGRQVMARQASKRERDGTNAVPPHLWRNVFRVQAVCGLHARGGFSFISVWPCASEDQQGALSGKPMWSGDPTEVRSGLVKGFVIRESAYCICVRSPHSSAHVNTPINLQPAA